MTLRRTLSLAIVGLAIVVASLLAVVLGRWGDSLLLASERLRDSTARRAQAMVGSTLDGALAALRSIEKQVQGGVFDLGETESIEAALFAQMIGNGELSEVTLTRGGDQPAQVTVLREGDSPPRLVTRIVRRRGTGFAVAVRSRPPGSATLLAAPLTTAAAGTDDPTKHITFTAAVEHRRFAEDPLWTDLHYAEVDAHLPEPQRRVVVTVMKALTEGAGKPFGVARVGLLARRLDEITRLRVDTSGGADAHRVFLADWEGRLITRLNPDDPLEDRAGDLRPAAGMLPPEVRAALAHPAVRDARAEAPRQSGRFELDGRAFLVSALHLAGAQDWRVAIVVPEDHYLGDLLRARRLLLIVCGVALALALLGGTFLMKSVQRSLSGIVASAERMREFDFSASRILSPFRDVRAVLEDIEQAKTALRALGKYVPLGLVRQLYRARQEPRLGGEPRDVTLMFTDIEGFTALSERLAPDTLATLLGRYLEAMTAAIHETGGTVDKYIGDGVMAFWNAPEPREGHAGLACRAALRCIETTRALCEAPEWSALPFIRTRFGLHRDTVLVGHYGAPDRIGYTALGDGVNLASRLEGLNKAYGTTILVSEAVRESATDDLAFRLVDIVAVKGKSRGEKVYELLGRQASLTETVRALARAYERAYAAYQARRFDEALALLVEQADDPPSQVLAERCRDLRRTPPPPEWDGVYVAPSK